MSDSALAERLRGLLDGDPRITEKKAFGGVMFLLNGHMLGAAKKDGNLLVRIGKPDIEMALTRDGATQMVHGGKVMTGFIWVDAACLDDDDDLASWVALAEKSLAVLPPK